MYTNLIETPLVASQLATTTVVILADLAQPALLWSSLTTLISSVKEYVTAALRTDQAAKLGLADRSGTENI